MLRFLYPRSIRAMVSSGSALSHLNGMRMYSTVPPEAQSTSPSGAGASAALEVAMAVNKIKRQHQQCNTTPEKKKMEGTAWKSLNSLTEDQIMASEGKAVALLLNSWAYFSKHWERGKEGPAEGGPADGEKQP